jgi:nitroimidazol reductase NimA-like FMN-containing flavoprotein (pyridoxamine 5'-phosphate oxidase superfamily)
MITQHGNIKSLPKEEVFKLFERGHFGHLACHHRNDLYLVPVTYAFHEGFIYSHSALGKKINIMRSNPQICIQVEEVESFFRWKSALAWGEFEELKDEEAARAMRILIKSFSEKEGSAPISELEADFSAQLENAIIYRIKILDFSGRSEGY